MKRIRKEPLKILSLGWGVQSFTIAAMAALGEIEPFDVAIHSNTTYESALTYAFISKWSGWLASKGVKVIKTVDLAATTQVYKHPEKRSLYIPAYFQSADKRTGKPKRGQLSRQCTDRWKIRPLRKVVTQLLKESGRYKTPGAVQQWLGISLDESQRMNTSDVAYIANRYPLIDLRMTRADCEAWLVKHNIEVPPKSACVFCPYGNKTRWIQLKNRGGVDWEVAQSYDNQIRKLGTRARLLFVHPSLKPLDDAIDPQLSFDSILDIENPGCSSAGYCWA